MRLLGGSLGRHHLLVSEKQRMQQECLLVTGEHQLPVHPRACPCPSPPPLRLNGPRLPHLQQTQAASISGATLFYLP